VHRNGAAPVRSPVASQGHRYPSIEWGDAQGMASISRRSPPDARPLPVHWSNRPAPSPRFRRSAPRDTRPPVRGAPGWQHASRPTFSRRLLASGPLSGPFEPQKAPKAAWDIPGGLRNRRMTSASAALVPILQISEPRDEASAQTDGPATVMGKLLGRLRRFCARHRDAAPHGRPRRQGSELILDAGEIHRILSAAGCMSLRRVAQEKVWGSRSNFILLGGGPYPTPAPPGRRNGRTPGFCREILAPWPLRTRCGR
jgi:hypothetical protein